MTAETETTSATQSRESSVNSLKELIIILTGLTITTGFAISFKSVIFHYFSHHLPDNSYFSVWWGYFSTIDESRLGNIARLFLLIVCVMRFHHGNIMVLDKNYVHEHKKHANSRNLFFDFLAILTMSIGFSSMGFATFDPVLFNTAYGFILLVSVIWTGSTLLAAVREAKRLGTSAFSGNEDIGERFASVEAQLRWFIVNAATFVVFAIIFPLDIRLKSEALLVIILINSFLDIWLNWSDYFPKPDLVARKTPERQAGGQ